MTEKEKARIDELIGTYQVAERFDVEAGLSRLHENLDIATAPAAKVRPIPVSRRSWIGAAAGFLLLFAFGYYFATSSAEKTYLAENAPLEIALPDGSSVLLNKGSQLSYGKDYGETNRELALVGEAYFSVEPDKERPLLVSQGDVTLRVVGTTFNLKADPDQDFFEVEVSSGKVMLETKADAIPVAAKELGRYRKQTGLSKQSSPNLNRHAWKTGIIVFSATPFSEVVEVVERTYDVVLKVSEKDLKRCDFPITASFKNVLLKDVLTHLEKLTSGRFLTSKSAKVYRLVDWCDK